MENASKALLIAGGVLIAILVASMGIYFARSMADQEAKIYARMEDTERTKFNQQFTQFSNQLRYDKDSDTYKSDNINIQDIITLIHLAKNSNKKNEFTNAMAPDNSQNDTSLYVTVNIENSSLCDSINDLLESPYACNNAEQFTDKILTKILNKEVKDNNKLYSCKIEINKNTGYVNYIEIN